MAYLPHNPSNAPESPKNDPSRSVPVATFSEFQAYYKDVFGEPLPDCWYDERSVCLHRRVLDARVGRLLLRLTGDTVELVNGSGEVVFAVNSLALEAMSFIADTGAFYVRELPGHLDNDEKIALVATLVGISCFVWRHKFGTKWLAISPPLSVLECTPQHANVCFGSLADTLGCTKKRPPYASKQTLPGAGIDVCFVPSADFDAGVRMSCLAPWRYREVSPSQHRLLGHHQSQEKTPPRQLLRPSG